MATPPPVLDPTTGEPVALWCSRCRTILPIRWFSRSKPNRSRFGRQYFCKNCSSLARFGRPLLKAPADPARPITNFPCCICGQVKSGEEFEWFFRAERGRRERRSYCILCRPLYKARLLVRLMQDPARLAKKKQNQINSTKRERQLRQRERLEAARLAQQRVRAMLDDGYSYAGLARTIGCAKSNLRRWLRSDFRVAGTRCGMKPSITRRIAVAWQDHLARKEFGEWPPTRNDPAWFNLNRARRASRDAPSLPSAP